MIQKQNRIPYYLQLADHLIGMIQRGELSVGDKIPSEMTLSRRYQVNRHTVRQAVAKLTSLGWVTTVKGVGSFVKQRPIVPYALSQHTRFSDEIDRLGRSHRGQLISWELDVATESERRQLLLSDSARVYRLEIVRYVDDEPFSVATSTLPENAVPNLGNHLDDFHSLYDILQTHYHFRPIRVRSVIRAMFCTVKEAMFLPKDSPILQIESLMIHPDGFPVEAANTRVRGDMNELTVEFHHGVDVL
ncbi:phosphonate metabolism transcriptional regulator PhnF [Kyrpidia sp.]|uniref:phosphonate metabolism transcriptional regulator PhnF n=1 Tax=Kyrpidia sp. TaxID=2073077 RepID=UPI0017F01288|nr:phosphonate metabolism transcriptional regulator PhnF [Kyrpidia sp.]MCL6576927.1 phosphonate metabolism transcriptional regulator PhnF [Kyrpidia sp.]HHY67113.1 phosphonate metabolism transcriptional regulator PhnF [Alicyclobacillus sp.]